MKIRFQFNLKWLLLLITLLSAGIALVSYLRATGRDALAEVLVDIEESYDPGVRVVVATNGTTSWLDRLLRNTKPQVHEIDFLTTLSANNLRRLGRNRTTQQIHTIRFFKSYFEDVPLLRSGSPLFFKHWRGLRRVVLRDVQIPETWHESFCQLEIEELVISGARCNLQPEELAEMPKLKLLTLCHRGIDSQRLEEIRQLMPNVEIRILGSFDTTWTFETDQALSKHDPAEFTQMKNILDRLQLEIKEKVAAVDHHFEEPATAQQINELERKLGMPLHKSVRAWLENSNGWPYYVLNELHNTNNIADDYESRKDLQGYDWRTYDFDLYHDHYSNPNVIPIGPTIGVCFVDGSIHWLDDGGESGPSRRLQIKDLYHYFELIRLEIEGSDPDVIFDGGLKGLWIEPDFWWEP